MVFMFVFTTGCGDSASDGSGYLALTLNGFGGGLDSTSPNGIEFESTCLIMDAEL